MCGISAYKGKKDAAPLLVQALRMLEYRGYDSAGIATLDESNVHIRKGVGKVNEVCASHGLELLKGPIGIAHTRWATTGAVEEKNAHPHISSSGRFVVVHNGIIENDLTIHEMLSTQGICFLSDTDTEIIAHLMDINMHDVVSKNFEEEKNAVARAVAKTLRDITGRNGFVILDAKTQCLFAARNGSPILLGISDHGVLISSDPAPLRTHVSSMMVLEDGDIALINENHEVIVFDAKELLPVRRELIPMNWSVESAEKGNYDHYMIKEIFDQKKSLFSALEQDPILFSSAVALIKKSRNVIFVGCGTTGSVALAGMQLFVRIAAKSARYAIGSEFSAVLPDVTADTVVFAISQSGETADTIEAIDMAKSRGATIVSIVNVEGSTIARKSDICFPARSGPERSVCSTKATTSQMAILALLAYGVTGLWIQGRDRLLDLANEVNAIFDEWSAQAKEIVPGIIKAHDIYLIGRGPMHAIAHEGAIKIQEVAYIHAQGFAGGELKHGPLALVSQGTPCIALIQNDENKEAIIANVLEAKIRGAKIIAISPFDHPGFDIWVRIPDMGEVSLIAALIPLQLLAYEMAVARGTDVDMPRNLAKSVTVK